MRYIRWSWAAGLAMMVAAPAAAQRTAPRDSGLIVSSMEAAVSRPVARLAKPAITVDLSERVLYLMDGDDVVRQFPVAVGESGYPTPQGSFQIRHMIWNPSWRPPPSRWARGKKYEAPGSPGNPMGRLKIFFREPDFYIHGTGLVSSLGRPASHGCIRMRNIDVAELGRILMEHGGATRPEAWFQETLAQATASRDVRLRTAIPVRIRA